MAGLGAGGISSERWKSMVEALNQLLSILLILRGLKVKASRQQVLDEKEVVLTQVYSGGREKNVN